MAGDVTQERIDHAPDPERLVGQDVFGREQHLPLKEPKKKTSKGGRPREYRGTLNKRKAA
jgi:hypothetical protein